MSHFFCSMKTKNKSALNFFDLILDEWDVAFTLLTQKNYLVNNNTQFERKKRKNMNKRTLNNICKPTLLGQEIFVSGQVKKAE